MDPVDDLDAKIYRKLRELNPHHVRVYTDEEHTDVKVPERRKRWAAVQDVIAQRRGWTRIELRDKAGMVLGEVQNDGGGEPGELEDLTARPGSAGAVAAQVRGLLEIMLRAQERALSFRDREHTTLLTSMAEMLRVNTEAVHSLAQIHRAQLDAAIDAATARAEAASGDDVDKLVKLLEASPEVVAKLAPILAPLLARLAPGPSRAKPKEAKP